ncbi:UNVERIFIED_CONTAM: hypothetical protein HDU68_006894, partial [Siphonaria sp. JEL0065]
MLDMRSTFMFTTSHYSKDATKQQTDWILSKIKAGAQFDFHNYYLDCNSYGTGTMNADIEITFQDLKAVLKGTVD